MGILDYIGQGIAGLGGIVSNVYGQDVRLGSGGSSLGANIAGQSQPYYSTTQNLQYSNQGINPYANVPAGYKGKSAAQIAAEKANQQQQPQQQQPQQQQQTSGGPGAITEGQALAMGLDWNNLPGGYSRAVSGGGQGDYEAQLSGQLNAAYDPAYANLSAVEAQYRQEYPTSQAFIEQSYGEVLPQLESEQATRISGQEAQMKKGKGEEKSQIAQARQLYNELRQSGLTRFGGASSTGEAYGELLGRTTAQQMGETKQQFGNLYQDIEKEKANINDFYAARKTNLEKEKQLRLQELKNEFDNSIRQINTQKQVLDAEKAARRIAALQEYSAQARQIQYESQKFAQQVDMWKAAKDEAIKTATQFNAKSFTIPGMPGVLGGFSVSGVNQGQQGYQTAQGYYNPEDLKQYGLIPTGYNTKTGAMTYGKNEEDITF